MRKPPPSRGRLLRFEPNVNAHQDNRGHLRFQPRIHPAVGNERLVNEPLRRTADATLRSRPIEVRSRSCRSRRTAATAASVGIADGRDSICERRGLDRSILRSHVRSERRGPAPPVPPRLRDRSIHCAVKGPSSRKKDRGNYGCASGRRRYVRNSAPLRSAARLGS